MMKFFSRQIMTSVVGAGTKIWVLNMKVRTCDVIVSYSGIVGDERNL